MNRRHMQNTAFVQKRKPPFLLAYAVLFAATFGFATLSISEYAMGLWHEDVTLALFCAGVFAVSALVTPAFMTLLPYARGLSFGACLLIVGVFSAIDSFGTSNALRSVELRLTQPAFDSAMKAYQNSVVPLQSRIAEAQNKLSNLEPEKHARSYRQEAATAAYQAQVSALQSQIAAARSELNDITKPVRADLINDSLVAVLAGLLQFVLAIGFWVISAIKKSVYEANDQTPKSPISLIETKPISLAKMMPISNDKQALIINTIGDQIRANLAA